MKHSIFDNTDADNGKQIETKNARNGGYLVGRSHKEGGIKGVNVDTGEPIEVEGGEVVITKPAVESKKTYTLNGKKMKPKEILSKLNSDHGGVAFAQGGQVGKKKYLLGGLTDDEKKNLIDARYAGKPFIKAQNDDLSTTVYTFEEWDKDSGDLIDIKIKMPSTSIVTMAMINAITIGDYLYLKGLGRVLGEGTYEIDNPSVDFQVIHIPFIITELIKDTDGTSYDEIVMERTYTTNDGTDRTEIMRWKQDGGWYSDRSICIPKIEIPDLSSPINSSDWLNGKIVLQSNGNQFTDNFNLAVFAYGEFTVSSDAAINCSYRLWENGGDYTAKRINPARVNDFTLDNDRNYLHAIGDIVNISYSDVFAYHDIMTLDNSQSKELFIHEGAYFLQGFDNNTPLFYSGEIGSEIYFKKSNFTVNDKSRRDVEDEKAKINNMVFYRDGDDRNIQLIGICFENLITGELFFIRLYSSDSREYFRITPVEPATPNRVGASTLSEEEKLIRRNRGKDVRDAQLYEILLEGLSQEEARLIVMKGLISSTDKVKNLNIDRRLNEIATLKAQYKLDSQTALNLLDQFETMFYAEKSSRESKSGDVSINGQPSELTPSQYERVRSPEFIDWFGDWMTAYELDDYTGVSKIMNPRTAEPMVLFHGTDVDFTAWKFNQFPAAYFGDNRSYSEWFANLKSQGGEGHMYECFINIKNPIDLRQYGLENHKMGDILNYLEEKYNLNPRDIVPELNRLNPEQFDQVMEVNMKAWQFVRRGVPFLNYVKENTFYDGILMFEDNPQDIITTTVNGEQVQVPNTTGSFVVFREGQIKWAGATYFNSIISDNRFAKGGKIKSLAKKYKEMDFVF